MFLLKSYRFEHYRATLGFALTDYHPFASNFIVLTAGKHRRSRPMRWIWTSIST